ncbi:cysteine desulfurase-like protein [Anaerolinea thermophila]|uniref:Cysteine desulphurase family protein n=1 Tax=Anaerolinea thermophila (strain DSM 14523 / JCM 11388 / NBRC 100420 / UNI-1) TaxID=926569 RepID=E8N4E3_ANATU|nr:cysteine desulfurase-like protein [Anaerolinea thermophila]BAJ63307.1 cysteine desulphurase family protein [Anaerolinea thermophila UNI-1]
MLNLAVIRSQFPALEKPVVFLDNPGGTQVARSVVERMTRYLTESNANHGGEFETSRISDAIVDEARQRMADFLNARRTEEIIFGPNMTSLTFQMSRALGKQLRPGDTIVVTRLDHDANISPWVKLAEDLRLTIRWVDFHPEDGTLNLEDFEQAMRERPRLVAFGYASNALGTVNPVAELVARAHRVGALTYVDAVQYAPHGPIDVQTLDVDFLVCSAYKFFGPHVGVLYGKYELLESLPAYKVRPAPEEPPGKFEMGTGNFEGIAGVLGALEYLEWMGKTFGGEVEESLPSQFTGRRRYFKSAMAAIRAYEFSLSRTLLDVLEEIPGIAIYGITDHRRLEERVPTVSFTLNGKNPKEVARMLDERQIQVWNGNFYALAVTQRLGLEESGGLVRVGPVHYNTIEELERLGRALWEIARMQ